MGIDRTASCAPEMERILDIRDLSVEYDTDTGLVKAVNGLNLALERGKTLGFVGETGAGKTTTALAVLQLIQSPPGRISGGRILFEGEDVMRMTESEKKHLRGGRISMIFQDPMTSLNPIMTIEDQIMEMIQLHTDLKGEDARRRAEEMLEMVGIRSERAKDYPHQLSGGMRQRVVIAIALACEPALLIADEPTTALDVTIQAQILDLIRELQNKIRTSMLLITHDLGVVAETCDDVAIAYAGTVVEYASVKDLFDHPLHPYTRGLFEAVPSLESDVGARLAVIPGLPPDPTALPEGCRFAPRCERAREVCRRPGCAMREVRPGHFVSCHFPLDGAGEDVLSDEMKAGTDR
ncbi:ABC transporter ATP-binding protein [Fretibacterium sp. OH1220_COT-178]|uniref:ABC transporter ATP-binding protein n=1 Tax=Fretibacterium sp. OH1220_COT-178 TaxID=2491047 RepID=UPI001F394B4B|nr:ABC transporter ATP-binding protein [Fretibacterium sp. OH1220_COT-178]